MTRCIPIVLTLVVLLATIQASPALGATRHRIYIGNITAITATTLVIHSKTHNTISRFLFKTGSYVTVSYSAGTQGTLVAWHVSMRK
jgi:hypothetical protein